jgi:hypothetical protein
MKHPVIRPKATGKYTNFRFIKKPGWRSSIRAMNGLSRPIFDWKILRVEPSVI